MQVEATFGTSLNPHARGGTAWRVSISAVLIATFAFQTSQQWQIAQEGDDGWRIGDWLIDYSGGFVRRGLFGWILSGTTGTAESSLLALWLTQTAIYAIIFTIAVCWIWTTPTPRSWFLAFLSPAFLLFGLSPFGGSYRKEIIFLLVLFVLAESLRRERFFRSATVFGIIVFALAVLSHELNSLLVIPLLILITWSRRDGLIDRAFATASSVGLVAIAVIGITLAVVWSGTVEQGRAICDQLLAIDHSPGVCTGAISVIGTSSSDALAEVIGAAFPRYIIWAFVAALASIPFLFMPWARANWRVLLFAAAGSLPLYAIAIDYGRWIVLTATVWTVLAFVGSKRDSIHPLEPPLSLMILFVLLWQVPLAGVPLPNSVFRGVDQFDRWLSAITTYDQLGQSLDQEIAKGSRVPDVAR